MSVQAFLESPRMQQTLDFPRAYFQVLGPGDGINPPAWVAEEELGLIYPLRYDMDPEGPLSTVGWKAMVTGEAVTTLDAVKIYTLDRIRALHQEGKNEAATWWVEYCESPYDKTSLPRAIGRILAKEMRERFF